ncbi:hypothetical protein [Janibacter terrae]|uniref:hypothetical protein n=1 Tax=Janibacter terrae TaxID=103817 RepID=UPI0031F84FAF
MIDESLCHSVINDPSSLAHIDGIMRIVKKITVALAVAGLVTALSGFTTMRSVDWAGAQADSVDWAGSKAASVDWALPSPDAPSTDA